MKKRAAAGCCDTSGSGLGGCCKVESLVTVDERGQMVLPKETRDRAGIRAGDKLALVSWERNGKVCCISLVKASEFEALVKDMLGPMLKDMI